MGGLFRGQAERGTTGFFHQLAHRCLVEVTGRRGSVQAQGEFELVARDRREVDAGRCFIITAHEHRLPRDRHIHHQRTAERKRIFLTRRRQIGSLGCDPKHAHGKQ
jgi:hypothetical protein